MALKVELKPHERIIIGACVITNTDQRARLLIDGDNIPILREKDILTPETADTPAKLVYLAVQLMYISPDPQVNHGTYFSLARARAHLHPFGVLDNRPERHAWPARTRWTDRWWAATGAARPPLSVQPCRNRAVGGGIAEVGAGQVRRNHIAPR